MSGVLRIEIKDRKTATLFLENPAGIVRMMPFEGNFNQMTYLSSLEGG